MSVIRTQSQITIVAIQLYLFHRHAVWIYCFWNHATRVDGTGYCGLLALRVSSIQLYAVVLQL